MYAIKSDHITSYKDARKLEQEGDLLAAAGVYKKLFSNLRKTIKPCSA